MFVFSAVYHLFVFVKTRRIRMAFTNNLLTADASEKPVAFHRVAEVLEAQAAGVSFLSRVEGFVPLRSVRSRWWSEQLRQVSSACFTSCLAG